VRKTLQNTKQSDTNRENTKKSQQEKENSTKTDLCLEAEGGGDISLDTADLLLSRLVFDI
jgi:hypothetical protein